MGLSLKRERKKKKESRWRLLLCDDTLWAWVECIAHVQSFHLFGAVAQVWRIWVVCMCTYIYVDGFCVAISLAGGQFLGRALFCILSSPLLLPDG